MTGSSKRIMKKLRVALLFGGKSAEHDASLMSAKNVYGALNPKKYEVTLVGITREGKWLTVDTDLLTEGGYQVAGAALQAKNADTQDLFVPQKNELVIYSGPEEQIKGIDVVIPILHGTYGEDGSIQGFCRMMGLPFVGPSVVGSAVGMDKDVMKRLLRDAGIAIGDFITLTRIEPIPAFSDVTERLGKVLFVKPANLGSSVGVSRVTNEKEYTEAVATAFTYDTKILIEEAIFGREIECAVLGNEHPRASLPGEVVTNTNVHEFYSYDAKYIDSSGSVTMIPAENLDDEKIKEIQEVAIQVFQVLCCEGMGRVDVFLTPEGKVVVNEINTIPGFTAISMYPKLWEASGLSYSKLLDTLIDLAMERFLREQKLSTR
jgi:D-alanine-D-alanine ligase